MKRISEVSKQYMQILTFLAQTFNKNVNNQKPGWPKGCPNNWKNTFWVYLWGVSGRD